MAQVYDKFARDATTGAIKADIGANVDLDLEIADFTTAINNATAMVDLAAAINSNRMDVQLTTAAEAALAELAAAINTSRLDVAHDALTELAAAINASMVDVNPALLTEDDIVSAIQRNDQRSQIFLTATGISQTITVAAQPSVQHVITQIVISNSDTLLTTTLNFGATAKMVVAHDSNAAGKTETIVIPVDSQAAAINEAVTLVGVGGDANTTINLQGYKVS